VAVTRIDEFMSKIGRQKGMSLTTGFDVAFQFGSKSTFPSSVYKDSHEDLIQMLCDEAQLPNVQTATGQMSGRYLGESAVQYAHSRMFTDVGLGFLCDADLMPIKFFNHWYSWIFGDAQKVTIDDYESVVKESSLPVERINRLKYPDEYTCSLYIMKTEPDNYAANGRIPITYILENAYPYAIDAVPLSYGASQITRVNVNFHYTRHTVVYGDIKSIKTGLTGVLLNSDFADDIPPSS
tara:strand:- start:70 stop:783 length:714 start_codon:yes stop_codon:yes gene_type:complete